MKKVFIFFCSVCFTAQVSAQQFSQYNTGTLFDSFENPSQRSFIPDSSRQFAFNFFIPNFNVNAYLTGNIQPGIKSRLFASPPYYNTSALQIGQGKYNHFNGNLNAYSLMFKMFSSLNGDVEMGFSVQTKMESRGLFSDESLALFSGPLNFPHQTYNDIFNDHYTFQSYHQISFSYREHIDDNIALGIKISGLLGIQYEKIDIAESHIIFDKIHDEAFLAMAGRYYNSFSGHSGYAPSFDNPGAAISIGTSYNTDDNITIQANLKDLGFIHWNNRSSIYNFNNSTTLTNISSAAREDTIYNGIQKIFKHNGIVRSFTSATDSRAEVSVTKSYWLDADNQFKFSPTLLVSKELFYPGFAGAFINHFQYNNFIFSATASYDDMNFFNIGAQAMIKSPNVEFFIGSDRLLNTGKFALASLNYSQINRVGNYSGGNLFLGFSLKFGRIITHSMNSSYIPMGDADKGFFGRLFGNIF